MRETIVPAAISALDFSRFEARPAGLLGAGAATGASSAAVRGAASWSRYRCAKASGSGCSSEAPVTRESTPTNWVVVAWSPYGRWREGPSGSGGGVWAQTRGSGEYEGAVGAA